MHAGALRAEAEAAKAEGAAQLEASTAEVGDPFLPQPPGSTLPHPLATAPLPQPLTTAPLPQPPSLS